jgi:hypothetical protein
MKKSDEKIALKNHQEGRECDSDYRGSEAQAVMLEISPGKPHRANSPVSQLPRCGLNTPRCG